MALPYSKWSEEQKEKDRTYKREWYNKNKEKFASYRCNSKEARKEYRLKNRDKLNARLRENSLKRNYGITVQQYDVLFSAQMGKCAVCGIERVGLLRNLAVDHNHETGAVRGLLCGRCNTALGSVKESVEILARMIAYITRHNGVSR